MTRNSKESGRMIDFILSRYETEDQEITETIRPLPIHILPSEQFVSETRVRLLRLSAGESASRIAA